MPTTLGYERFHLACLELLNSAFCKNGFQRGDVWEGLAEFPEPYMTLPVRDTQGDGAECEPKESEEHNTPEAFPGISSDGTPVETPVVSIPDANPACLCCSTWFTRMLGLIEHLKRAHGQKDYHV